MVNEQSVFRFDLNESLYFEKGQEVDEIMGISLEPEISIQELNDYISIRGVVELQGSYQKAEHIGDAEEDSDSYYDGYDSKRYMERVYETEHGAAEFLHRFPVEITVPSNRVNNLDDVSVMIAEFDYELPESNHLYLRSTIEIHGINSQVEEVVSEDSKEEESNEENELTERDMEESFEFEVQHENESSSYIEDSPEQLPTLSGHTDEDESESGRWKFSKEKTQTFDEFFQKNEETQVNTEEEESSSSIMEEYVDVSLEESDESREEKADLTYLADIFRTEEEEYTKVKVRIVQEKDTLEALAEKYETTTMLIRNQNRLEDDNLSEGQLLYIPTKK